MKRLPRGTKAQIMGTRLFQTMYTADQMRKAVADERKRLEQAVEELAPVRDNPLLQNKPAAFWVENFKQIVRGNT